MSMSDEGFHEIQLNGKQLVFLFIAVTTASVLIFLCGVLVGRGVRAERLAASAEGVPVSPIAVAPDSDAQKVEAPPSPGPDPATTPPSPAEKDLTYFERLESDRAPKETLKAQNPEKPVPAPKPIPRAPESPKPSAPAVTSEPSGDGFSVQIAALRERSEAEGIVKRLSGKGYRAYVMPPPAGGSAAVYRVRVGKFKNRREAENVATRLEKEEQFKPWIIR